MNKRVVVKLAAIVGLVLLLISIRAFTPLGDWLNLENIIQSIKDSGPWGFVLFAILFVIGSLIHVPAMIFVLAAILVYGQWAGTALGYFGLVLGMIVNFYVIKTIGNRLLHELKGKRVQKILSKLESKPLETIFILRLILWAAPVLNYTLAMTGVKSKDYIIASALGIIIPLLIFSGAVYFFSEIVIPWVS